jgi:hypothetical protein
VYVSAFCVYVRCDSVVGNWEGVTVCVCVKFCAEMNVVCIRSLFMMSSCSVHNQCTVFTQALEAFSYPRFSPIVDTGVALTVHCKRRLN